MTSTPMKVWETEKKSRKNDRMWKVFASYACGTYMFSEFLALYSMWIQMVCFVVPTHRSVHLRSLPSSLSMFHTSSACCKNTHNIKISALNLCMKLRCKVRNDPSAYLFLSAASCLSSSFCMYVTWFWRSFWLIQLVTVLKYRKRFFLWCWLMFGTCSFSITYQCAGFDERESERVDRRECVMLSMQCMWRDAEWSICSII